MDDEPPVEFVRDAFGVFAIVGGKPSSRSDKVEAMLLLEILRTLEGQDRTVSAIRRTQSRHRGR